MFRDPAHFSGVVRRDVVSPGLLVLDGGYDAVAGRVNESELGPCPRCRKREGVLNDLGRGKFRYYVSCGACVFLTALARTEGIAVKLWNEAKPVRRPGTKPKARGR